MSAACAPAYRRRPARSCWTISARRWRSWRGRGLLRSTEGRSAARSSGTSARRAGGITSADLAAYRVVRRRPVRAAFRGHEFVSNPPPSSGGVLIGYGLRLLDGLGPNGPSGSAEAAARLVEATREQGRARLGSFANDLHRGGLAKRLYADESLRRGLRRIRDGLAGVAETGPRGTTHISVVDSEGNAASLTASTGSGSGVIVPGTGVHLNNMLGEYDLNPAGAEARPGSRLTSMMAPSLVVRRGRPRLVLGSAGSVRLRGAILQAAVNVIDHGLPVEEAITAPRIHLDEPHVHCEGGTEAAEVDRLEQHGYEVVRWRRRNLYFGGVSAVEVGPDGSLRGRRRPASRRARDRSPMTDFWVWPALPGDAAQLVSLAEAVGSELEAWLISDSRWCSVSDERRYLRAARRHPDAAIFVAEAPEGIVGRLSVSPRPAPGQPPTSPISG